jgi:hypothetical protein
VIFIFLGLVHLFKELKINEFGKFLLFVSRLIIEFLCMSEKTKKHCMSLFVLFFGKAGSFGEAFR